MFKRFVHRFCFIEARHTGLCLLISLVYVHRIGVDWRTVSSIDVRAPGTHVVPKIHKVLDLKVTPIVS